MSGVPSRRPTEMCTSYVLGFVVGPTVAAMFVAVWDIQTATRFAPPPGREAVPVVPPSSAHVDKILDGLAFPDEGAFNQSELFNIDAWLAKATA